MFQSLIEETKNKLNISNSNTEPIAKGSVIQNFYDGANIFITGGTGFMGKVLIEKLLRSCPGIKNIYLLIREKKGKDIHSRIEELFDDPLFEKLREAVPKFRHKIAMVAGDCSVTGLGLSLTDRQTLVSHISIIFHAAATVRFDENLKLAVDINARGTNDVIELGKEMKNLKSFIHVSTAYSNCHLSSIEEKLYEYPTDYDHIVNLISKLNEKEVEEITPRLLCKWPNTYALTKAIAEDLVKKHSANLPIGVFRPAIVISTFQEPVVGWIDNMYGPTGIVAGSAAGVLRTMHCDNNVKANIVPVDMAVNALIVSAYDVATKKTQQSNTTHEIPVFNYVSSVQNPLTWGRFTDLTLAYGREYPFSRAIWHSCFSNHKSAFVNQICMIFWHLLPGLFIDFLLICCMQKPKLLKAYKKIHKLTNVVSYFATKEWTFANDNVQKLWLDLNADDRKLFYFDMQSLDWEDYFRGYIIGLRIYLLKDDMSNVPEAKKKWRRLFWLHQIVKHSLLIFLVYFLYRLYRSIA